MLLKCVSVLILVLSYFSWTAAQEGSCDFQSGVSNDGAFRRLQPPPGCQTGWFLWHYPRDTVNLTFPRSLLPSGSSNKMKVCFKLGVGQGLLEITQKTRRRSRTLPSLSQDTSNRGGRTKGGKVAEGGRSWSCSRSTRSRRGVQITLHAKPEPTYLQSLQYRVEEVTRSSGSGNRRPGRRPAGTNPNRGRGRNRDRGGRHTFPLGPGEHPMSPNYQVRRDPETTSS